MATCAHEVVVTQKTIDGDDENLKKGSERKTTVGTTVWRRRLRVGSAIMN